MNNFSKIFTNLKNERGLSNKQIASFTGVNQKEVKKWESGLSFPTDSKVLNALEGLLGTEISKSLKNFENNFENKVQNINYEESIFKVNKEKIDLKNTKLDRVRTSFKRKNPTLNKSSENYENQIDDTFISLEQSQPSEIMRLKDKEMPYIYDTNQIGFYFSRNIKTFAMLGLFLVIIVTSFSLFWDSVVFIIDALF